MDRIVLFQSFDDNFLANIVKAKLESNNIKCYLTCEITASLKRYGKNTNCIELHLFEDDVKEAHRIIKNR